MCYLGIHMDVLYWGSYLSSSHSSANVGTPTHYNDQPILILKVSWLCILSHFGCTNTPLPTCAWYFRMYVYFSTGLIRHKLINTNRKKYKPFNYHTCCIQAGSNMTFLGHPQLHVEIKGSKVRFVGTRIRKNTTEQSFSYHVFKAHLVPG